MINLWFPVLLHNSNYLISIIHLIAKKNQLGLKNLTTASLQKGKTLILNKSSGYENKPSDGEAPGALGNVEYPFIAITPRPTLIQSISICRILSISGIGLFTILETIYLSANRWALVNLKNITYT